VLPVVDHRLVYVIAILSGSLVTAITITLIKKFTDKPAVAAAKQV
jgi:fructose-specific phosphotransferase system IIC component